MTPSPECNAKLQEDLLHCVKLTSFLLNYLPWWFLPSVNPIYDLSRNAEVSTDEQKVS